MIWKNGAEMNVQKVIRWAVILREAGILNIGKCHRLGPYSDSKNKRVEEV